jgi:hypothetical protein
MLLVKQSIFIRHHLSGIGLKIVFIGCEESLEMLLFKTFCLTLACTIPYVEPFIVVRISCKSINSHKQTHFVKCFFAFHLSI